MRMTFTTFTKIVECEKSFTSQFYEMKDSRLIELSNVITRGNLFDLISNYPSVQVAFLEYYQPVTLKVWYLIFIPSKGTL